VVGRVVVEGGDDGGRVEVDDGGGRVEVGDVEGHASRCYELLLLWFGIRSSSLVQLGGSWHDDESTTSRC
jgi:hypothetical protein